MSAAIPFRSVNLAIVRADCERMQSLCVRIARLIIGLTLFVQPLQGMPRALSVVRSHTDSHASTHLRSHAPTHTRSHEGTHTITAAQQCNTLTTTPSQTWAPPLDRRISVRGGVVSLRDALDRVAASAKVRLSYSSTLAPLERQVCLELRQVALGDALTALLEGTSLAPLVAGAQLVVLAPQPSASTRPPMAAAMTVRSAPLERVVITGSATGGAQRALSVSVGVVDGSSLNAHASQSLAESINGRVAGMWMWEQSPTSVLARYGSIRGASSFGLSYPKVYIDGVEVANPLVVAQLPAESIDRLEILRGPQGAALYGTDAISGVVQLITRLPVRNPDAPVLRVRAQAGLLSSDFSDGRAFGQEVVLSANAGDIARSAAGTFSFARVGAFVPEAASQHISASGRARAIGQNAVLDFTARLSRSDVASTSNPILLGAISDAIVLPDSLRPLVERRQQRLRDSAASRLQLDRIARQSLQQFTGGVTGTVYSNARWTHRVLVGVDAYSLDGVPAGVTPLPTSSDSALRAAQGSAMRLSTRASSAASWTDSSWQRTLTFSAEHAVLREATTNEVLARPRQPLFASTASTDVWRQTTGAVVQLDAAWHNRLYLTAGTRLERSAGFTAQPLNTLLPMIGAAWVHDSRFGTAKVRGAYGKGVRPPRITVGGSALSRGRLIPNNELDAETQSGTEFGVDLFLGSRFTMHATRFDQSATGLVQPVSVVALLPPAAGARPGDPFNRSLAFQMQNVGAIDNRGWEVESIVRGGAFSVQGSLSLVDSRVREIRRGYTGELRVGDRMLDVPARTMGVSTQWVKHGWSTSASITRVDDWIGYDRIAASQAFVSPGLPATAFIGESLRAFWIRYPAVTRVGATVSRSVLRGATLRLVGENLLNTQVGEPDNATIVPGRTVSVGLFFDFQRRPDIQ